MPMNKAGLIPVACHQAVSFGKYMVRIPRAEAIFWPGCALMTLEPAILEKTMAVLRRAEPEIQMAAACCGNPTNCLFPKKAEKRKSMLLEALCQQGVKRIYTACPNCTIQLGEYGLEVLPIWHILAGYLSPEDMEPVSGAYVWHDPCPTRRDPVQQEAVRKILALRGCDWTEPENTGCRTLCCGNRKMLHCTEPEKSAKLRKVRVAQFPADRIISSSCEGCLSAFRGEHRQTAHLLELLFGTSKSHSWINRFRNTWNHNH